MRTVKKPEERRAEIVAAATELFLHHGFDDTTMSDMIARVGIAKGTVYHYFASKDALLDAVVTQLATAYRDRRLAQADPQASALAQLEQLFSPERISQDEREATEHLHTPGNVKLHVRLLAELTEQMAPALQRLIEQGARAGVFSCQQPLEVAELLIAGIQFLTDEGVSDWGDATIARRQQAFPGIVESLLRAPPGSFAFLRA
ncbi:MAG: TetR/AcrR family transcriptional regulator [Planctomycetota bacterium]